MDRDDISVYRYKPHAPAHDFFATCLQLGDLWLSSIEKQFLSEQVLASLHPTNFPPLIRNAKGHVPDGITLLGRGMKPLIVGYEVDLNLKEEARYGDAARYLEDIDVHLVIWLVRNAWIRIESLSSL